MDFEIREKTLFFQNDHFLSFVYYMQVGMLSLVVFKCYSFLIHFLRSVWISNLSKYLQISKYFHHPERRLDHLFSDEFNMVLVGMIILHALFLISWKISHHGEVIFYLYTGFTVVRILHYLSESLNLTTTAKIIKYSTLIPGWEEMIKKYCPGLVPKQQN